MGLLDTKGYGIGMPLGMGDPIWGCGGVMGRLWGQWAPLYGVNGGLWGCWTPRVAMGLCVYGAVRLWGCFSGSVCLWGSGAVLWGAVRGSHVYPPPPPHFVGSPFRDEITLAILQLQENTRLEILKRKWWEGGRCPKEEDRRAKGGGGTPWGPLGGVMGPL